MPMHSVVPRRHMGSTGILRALCCSSTHRLPGRLSGTQAGAYCVLTACNKHRPTHIWDAALVHRLKPGMTAAQTLYVYCRYTRCTNTCVELCTVEPPPRRTPLLPLVRFSTPSPTSSWWRRCSFCSAANQCRQAPWLATPGCCPWPLLVCWLWGACVHARRCWLRVVDACNTLVAVSSPRPFFFSLIKSFKPEVVALCGCQSLLLHHSRAMLVQLLFPGRSPCLPYGSGRRPLAMPPAPQQLSTGWASGKRQHRCACIVYSARRSLHMVLRACQHAVTCSNINEHGHA